MLRGTDKTSLKATDQVKTDMSVPLAWVTYMLERLDVASRALSHAATGLEHLRDIREPRALLLTSITLIGLSYKMWINEEVRLFRWL